MKLTLLEKIHQRLAEYPRLGRALEREAIEAGVRWCYGCHELKELENFHRDRGAYESKCKMCKSTAAKKRYRPRPKKLKAPCYPVARKKCSGCQQDKTWSEFSARAGRWSGLESQCRECRNVYYKANKETYHERTNNYRRNVNPWAAKLSSGYRRAVKAGVPAEKVTTKQLLKHWKSVGISPNQSVYSGAELGPGRWSLDHVIPLSDPNGPGHTARNLVPCLVHENSRKSNQHFVVYLGALHDEKS